MALPEASGVKVVYFAKKYTCISKIPWNLLFIVFQNEIFPCTYIFTKCIDNLKFSISWKSYEVYTERIAFIKFQELGAF